MIQLIESALYISVTALFILLFKRLFKNKLSARSHMWIWALLAIRLFLPSLPESSLSVFNAIEVPERVEEYNDELQLTIAEDGQSVYEKTDDTVIVKSTVNVDNAEVAQYENSKIQITDTFNTTEVHQGVEAEADAAEKVSVEVQEQNETESNKSTFGLSTKKANADYIINAVRYAGTAVILLYFVVVYCTCLLKNSKRKHISDKGILNLFIDCKRKIGVRRNVSLISGGDNPMLMGVVKPSIILPEGYSEDENRDILIHELCHLKNGDIYLLWFAMIVLCFNWYNPIMWVCFFAFRRDIEVYCDARVLKYTDSKRDYATLLVKTALRKNTFIAGTTSLQNGEKEVERRVKYMAYFKKPRAVLAFLIGVTLLAIGVACLTDPKHMEHTPDEQIAAEHDNTDEQENGEIAKNAVMSSKDSDFVEEDENVKTEYALQQDDDIGVSSENISDLSSTEDILVNEIGFENESEQNETKQTEFADGIGAKQENASDNTQESKPLINNSTDFPKDIKEEHESPAADAVEDTEQNVDYSTNEFENKAPQTEKTKLCLPSSGLTATVEESADDSENVIYQQSQIEYSTVEKTEDKEIGGNNESVMIKSTVDSADSEQPVVIQSAETADSEVDTENAENNTYITDEDETANNNTNSNVAEQNATAEKSQSQNNDNKGQMSVKNEDEVSSDNSSEKENISAEQDYLNEDETEIYIDGLFEEDNEMTVDFFDL